MSALSIRSGNSNQIVRALQDLQLDLEDIVTGDLLTKAVILTCGHAYNENTVADLKASSSHAACPKCQKPITDYTISYTLRSIAEKVHSLVEAQPITSTCTTTTNNREVEEAKKYYKLGKALCEQGLQAEGVSAILKALELRPVYDKALMYLDFVTTEVKRHSLNPDLADALRPRITTSTQTTTSGPDANAQVDGSSGEVLRNIVAGDNNPAPVPNGGGDGQVNGGQGQAPVGLIVAGGNNPAPVPGRMAQVWNVLYPAGAAAVRNTPAVAYAISEGVSITFQATYPAVLALAEATPGAAAKAYEIAAPVCVVMKDCTVVTMKALWRGGKFLYATANTLPAIDQGPGDVELGHGAAMPFLIPPPAPKPLPGYAENVNQATHEMLDYVGKLVGV